MVANGTHYTYTNKMTLNRCTLQQYFALNFMVYACWYTWVVHVLREICFQMYGHIGLAQMLEKHENVSSNKRETSKD